MRKVMAISAVCTVLGYAAVYFAFFAKPKPAIQAEETAAQANAEPVVLATVVEVTDTDALLDPRPAPDADGAPFDAEPVGYRRRAGSEPIPPAAEYEADDEVEVAPMPHEASVRPPLDAWRVAWYGDQPFHRQVTEGMRQRRLYPNSGEWHHTDGTGVGFFF